MQLTSSDRKLAVLLDPDKHDEIGVFEFVSKCAELAPDYIMIGGSLITRSSVSKVAALTKQVCDIPTVLFPGHFTHLCDEVDHILLLSLISGRNPDLLIGQHVQSAIELKRLKSKLCPTGYMIIDGGKPTSVSYMSNTNPIPAEKYDIAVSTAIAGESLGLKMIYMDAGSGAEHRIGQGMINAVAQSIDVPLIVGGGIRGHSQITDAWEAGANLVVIGNGLESQPALFEELMAVRNRGEAGY